MAILDEAIGQLLSRDNKVGDTTGQEQLAPELTLDMDDEELIQIAKKWETSWDQATGSLKKLQEESEKYWLGDHFSNAEKNVGRAMNADNLIFEALETFLPMATSKNPEPVVNCEGGEEQDTYAKYIQETLSETAEDLRLDLKMKQVVRFWAIYMLGYVRVSWDSKTNWVDTQVRRPQNLILDDKATINDMGEYTGKYIGEKMPISASDLSAMFPEKESEIRLKYGENMGTETTYTMWWHDEYVFWTWEKIVLGKSKNPNWNYDTETPEGTVTGINHFKAPKKPYVFLSIFKLGKHPYDDTSLITQNLSTQDIINTRQKQIHKNVSKMNGGWMISGEKTGLNKEQATVLLRELELGGGGYQQTGNAGEGVANIQAPPLPADVYNNLSDMREELRNKFGVRGSSPSGTVNEQTATGKTIVRQQDTDRVSSGITKYIEQFADSVCNHWVQLIYVYSKDKQIQKYGAQFRLKVSVKPDSMIPDDPAAKAQQAVELATAGLLDPITMYEALNFPDPKAAAKRLFLWKNSPMTLFPDDPEIQKIVAQQEAAQLEADKQGVK